MAFLFWRIVIVFLSQLTFKKINYTEDVIWRSDGVLDVLVMIVLNVILPVIALIGVGAFLHRKFSFDMNTLSKLNNFFNPFSRNGITLYHLF